MYIDKGKKPWNTCGSQTCGSRQGWRRPFSEKEKTVNVNITANKERKKERENQKNRQA